MKHRILWMIVSCLILQLSSFAKEREAITKPRQTTLTPDQALAAARSATATPGTSLQVLREVHATASTRDVAQRSREESDLHHVALYGHGIFLDVLNSGGFLILESDPATESALCIYLVSSAGDGHPVIESHAVEGTVTSPLAAELVSQTAEVADALLTLPSSRLKDIEGRFSDGRFPQYERPGERSVFSIPRNLRKLKADESQYRDLAALLGGYLFWPVRYAMWTSIYAANPISALKAAHNRQEALTAQFLQKHSKRPDFIYDLQDLDALTSPEQLRDRISWLRQLDDFLDERASESEGRFPTFAANSSISILALQLGSFGNGKQDSFSSVTSPGVIVDWKRVTPDTLAVTGISLAEESNGATGGK
jgi:hypothetical protein